MQAIHSLRIAPYPLDLEPSHHHPLDNTRRAIETRTYWGCFIMDCMVNSGSYNPPMLPMSEMKKLKVPSPPSTVEYAFGSIPAASPRTPLPARIDRIEALDAEPGEATFDVTQGFEVLVTGFNIWTQLMTFIFNDGRRAPGMCAPANCPWEKGSPWHCTRDQLLKWRSSQAAQLKYPQVPVAVHMTLGYGETFVYLNLLFHVR